MVNGVLADGFPIKFLHKPYVLRVWEVRRLVSNKKTLVVSQRLSFL